MLESFEPAGMLELPRKDLGPGREGLLGLRGHILHAVQWTQRWPPPHKKETVMNRTRSRRVVPSTHRTRRPSLSPYYMDETAFTLADILRGRALDASSAKN